ncbi:MAG: non-canonical purine NTP pyrophosphatase [Flavobacteriaceae bacterium]|nr:MAG: non-canonical purine NTP pyrophosphatase [Flavobacteriaceae bacterium]
MEIVFATNNANKLKEVQAMVPKHIKILSLKDINCLEDIPETADTLEGNAILKANHVTKNYGYNCFADDTGLEVTALNNAPGVYSARYAGIENNAENNMQKLLDNLSNKTDRSAQFRTAVCLNLNGNQTVFEGICKGEILTKKQGIAGFGYDPIFMPADYPISFAEMDMQTKGKISHRGLAIQKLVSYLNTLLA